MGIAIPIAATAIALPACAIARLGLAYLVGFYCGVTRTKSHLIFTVIDASNLQIAAFVASATWVAWALSTSPETSLVLESRRGQRLGSV
jgi:hypothetical protein